MILVTGGAGFTGAHFVPGWLSQSDESVLKLDKPTCSGKLDNLAALRGKPGRLFVRGDIGGRALPAGLLGAHRPRAIRSSCRLGRARLCNGIWAIVHGWTAPPAAAIGSCTSYGG